MRDDWYTIWLIINYFIMPGDCCNLFLTETVWSVMGNMEKGPFWQKVEESSLCTSLCLVLDSFPIPGLALEHSRVGG